MRILPSFHQIIFTILISARPVLFAVGFSGVSIAGCAVWDYEERERGALRTRLRSFGFGGREAK